MNERKHGTHVNCAISSSLESLSSSLACLLTRTTRISIITEPNHLKTTRTQGTHNVLSPPKQLLLYHFITVLQRLLPCLIHFHSSLMHYIYNVHKVLQRLPRKMIHHETLESACADLGEHGQEGGRYGDV